jgi:hypothetical protein
MMWSCASVLLGRKEGSGLMLSFDLDLRYVAACRL